MQIGWDLSDIYALCLLSATCQTQRGGHKLNVQEIRVSCQDFFSGATLDFRKGFVVYTFCILEVPRVSLGIWCAKSLKTSRRVQMTWLKNASTTHTYSFFRQRGKVHWLCLDVSRRLPSENSSILQIAVWKSAESWRCLYDQESHSNFYEVSMDMLDLKKSAICWTLVCCGLPAYLVYFSNFQL